MNRQSLGIIAVLTVLLVGSNAWWVYRALDQASIDKYQELELDYRLKSARAALQALPPLSADLRRDQVVARVAATLKDEQPFDKDGWTVIAPLTFRFDAAGKLVEAATVYGSEP